MLCFLRDGATKLLLLGGAVCDLRLLILAVFQTLHEALNLTSGVDDALLTGVKRVAVGAYVQTQALLGGDGGPLSATAGADVRGLKCFGMNALLHHLLLTVQPRQCRH